MQDLGESYVFYRQDGSLEMGRRHVNPDGSVGGWVANSAIVDPNAMIPPSARVMPGAVVCAELPVPPLAVVLEDQTILLP